MIYARKITERDYKNVDAAAADHVLLTREEAETYNARFCSLRSRKNVRLKNATHRMIRFVPCTKMQCRQSRISWKRIPS